MPIPTAADSHVDSLLTDVSTAYIQADERFIAGQVFPRVPVAKQSDKFVTYTKDDWFRDEAEVRADATESAGSGFNLGTDTYFTDVYAFHKDVGDHVRANADPAINPDTDATEFVTQRLMLRQEIQWVTEFFTTSVWGTDKTPTNLWSSYTTSDPVDDIELGKETILQNTGMEANTFAVSYQVWRQLKNHPDLIDRFKYTSAQSISVEMLAAIIEVDRVIVSKSVKNTAREGASSPTMAFTAVKDALLAHVAPSPGLLTPSAGYTFSWTGISAGLGTDVAISSFRIDELKADRIEGEVAFDFKVVGSDLGYFFNNAVA